MKALFAFFLFSLCIPALAQEETIVKEEFVQKPIHKEAEFPGGQQALQNYLLTNITIPDTARALEVSGIVYIQFVIDTNGRTTDIDVLRGVHWSLDQEAERVIRHMPKWSPGRDSNDKKIPVKFTLPIQFRY